MENQQQIIDQLRAQLTAATQRAERAIDDTDHEWLDAIGIGWRRLTGKPWDTLDGETREEGLSANIGQLMAAIELRDQTIAQLRTAKEKAEAACAEKDAAIRKHLDAAGSYNSETGFVEQDGEHMDLVNALCDCGKGYVKDGISKESFCKELTEALLILKSMEQRADAFGRTGTAKQCRDVSARLQKLMEAK